MRSLRIEIIAQGSFVTSYADRLHAEPEDRNCLYSNSNRNKQPTGSMRSLRIEIYSVPAKLALKSTGSMRSLRIEIVDLFCTNFSASTGSMRSLRIEITITHAQANYDNDRLHAEPEDRNHKPPEKTHS